jgi:hypothetical protein
MTDSGSSRPRPNDAGRPSLGSDKAATESQTELPDIASELLAIVRYIIAADGPLQLTPAKSSRLSPWHERLLLKALDRLDLMDAYLRGRVAFFVAAKDRGYGFFAGDLDLATVALDTCRATTLVVEALLAGRLPTGPEFDAMCQAALGIYPALPAD